MLQKVSTRRTRCAAVIQPVVLGIVITIRTHDFAELGEETLGIPHGFQPMTHNGCTRYLLSTLHGQ